MAWPSGRLASMVMAASDCLSALSRSPFSSYARESSQPQVEVVGLGVDLLLERLDPLLQRPGRRVRRRRRGRRVARRRLPGKAGPEGVRERHAGHDREHDHARDEHDPAARALLGAGRTCGRDVDAVAQRADHRGGTSGVVVVQLLVGLVVDATALALELEVVERLHQEVALVLELSPAFGVELLSHRRCPRPGARARRDARRRRWRGGAARHGCAATRTRCPWHPSATTTTGRTHTSRLTPESSGASRIDSPYLSM